MYYTVCKTRVESGHMVYKLMIQILLIPSDRINLTLTDVLTSKYIEKMTRLSILDHAYICVDIATPTDTKCLGSNE